MMNGNCPESMIKLFTNGKKHRQIRRLEAEHRLCTVLLSHCYDALNEGLIKDDDVIHALNRIRHLLLRDRPVRKE